MDDLWTGVHGTLKFGSVFREALPEKPSFYFHRNCFLGTQMSANEIARRHEIGVDNVIWGNDFPIPRALGRTPGSGSASGTTTSPKRRPARFSASTRCVATTSMPQHSRRWPTALVRPLMRYTTSRRRPTLMSSDGGSNDRPVRTTVT